jgi:hypothetical protein
LVRGQKPRTHTAITVPEHGQAADGRVRRQGRAIRVGLKLKKERAFDAIVFDGSKRRKRAKRQIDVSSLRRRWQRQRPRHYDANRSSGDSSMGSRWICILVVLLGAPSFAYAGERSGVLRRVSCSMVRLYVAKYSAPAAEQWARSKGATDAEIDAARRCLSADTVRTARAPTRPLALGSYGW